MVRRFQCEYEKRVIAHILVFGKAKGNGMRDTLQRLFQYKARANDELLTALATLGSESPVTGLAIKALSHSYVVDRIFSAHMKQERHGYTSANLAEMPALDALSADMRASDQDYIDY